jgi:rare lipoprotein A
MDSRANRYFAALLAVSSLGLAAPALVRAASGGAAPGGGGSAPGGATNTEGAGANPNASTQPGNLTVTASGNGITFATTESGLLRKPQQFTGNAGSAAAGKIVEIERRGRETGFTWAPTTHGTVASNGSFSATWPTNHIGQFAIRAVLETGDQVGSDANAAASSPALTITVYRPSLATQYGPGFYGQKTACGSTLRRSTIGVANKTLKCGTLVAVYYEGRTLTVPVIDRGPYANHADWDLTEATGRALGISGTATIGAVSLPGAH